MSEVMQDEHVTKRKPDLRPFRSASDDRVKLLQTCKIKYGYLIIINFILILTVAVRRLFIPYLKEWETSVAALPDLSQSEKTRRCLSPATLLGLRLSGTLCTPLAHMHTHTQVVCVYP